uniref:Uncharacterized protein n=1 Tax=Rhizophora mucronata TaxID=61149 RepID=A0A2P2QUG1_RHIMU
MRSLIVFVGGIGIVFYLEEIVACFKAKVRLIIHVYIIRFSISCCLLELSFSINF